MTSPPDGSLQQSWTNSFWPRVLHLAGRGCRLQVSDVLLPVLRRCPAQERSRAEDRANARVEPSERRKRGDMALRYGTFVRVFGVCHSPIHPSIHPSMGYVVFRVNASTSTRLACPGKKIILLGTCDPLVTCIFIAFSFR